MKSLFTTIALVSFIGIAVFGIFDMHSDMKNQGNGCVAARAQGTNCSKHADAVEYLVFHLEAFKNFSTATLSNITESLLIILLLAVGLAFGILPRNLAPKILTGCRLQRPNDITPPLRKIIRWLAFHENSPARL